MHELIIYIYYRHVLASYYHGTLHDLIVWCILIRMFLSWRNPSEAYQKSVQSSIFQPRSRGWLVSRSTEGRICSRHAAGSESGCAAENLDKFLKDEWTRIDPEKADVRHMLERRGILAAKITHADQILTVTGEQLQSLHFECPQPTEKSDSWRFFFNIEIKPSKNAFFQAITPSRTLVIFRPTSTHCSLLKLGIFIIQKDRSPINWCRTCPNKPPMAGFSTLPQIEPRRIPMESTSMPWDFQERIDLSLC